MTGWARTRRGDRRFHGAQLAMAVVVLASAGAACAGSRNSLGTAAGSCFRALPAARDAIHGKGNLVGVRRVSSDTLARRLPNNAKLKVLTKQELCVLAFSGTYPPGAVSGAINTTTRRYAVIAVTDKHPEVVATVVVDQLPTRFRHLR